MNQMFKWKINLTLKLLSLIIKCGNSEISLKIQFLQQNIDRNSYKMHTCLEIGLEFEINYILFQESYINIIIKITISYSAYYYIISKNEEIRLKVIIFTKKSLRF